MNEIPELSIEADKLKSRRYTFSWVVTRREHMTMSVADLDGVDVIYDPTSSNGKVIVREGKAFFKFEDMEDEIPFDSIEGAHTLQDCII